MRICACYKHFTPKAAGLRSGSLRSSLALRRSSRCVLTPSGQTLRIVYWGSKLASVFLWQHAIVGDDLVRVVDTQQRSTLLHLG